MDQTDRKEQQISGVSLPARTADQAYRKMCFILLLMTVALFAINVLQVVLLPITTHWAWINLFPAIVFAFFLVWLTHQLVLDRNHFFTGSSVRHFKSHLYRQARNAELCDDDTDQWPTKLAKFGVAATVIFNIVLVEFVYLNTSAIPAYERVVWRTGYLSPTETNKTTPSLALIQQANVKRTATLSNNTAQIDDMCDEKRNATFNNQRCFRNWNISANGRYYYVTFDSQLDPDGYDTLELNDDVDVWYAFNYDGSETEATESPILRLAVFHPELLENLDDFEQAYQCGITTTVDILARNRNRISLTPYAINDKMNAMSRTDSCHNQKFRQYTGYDLVLSQLDREPAGVAGGPCDTRFSNQTGPCFGDVEISFSTLLTSEHTSRRSINWKTIFTEEGGITGYVMFFTWFFDIFAK